jgi:hypothetical protein
MTSLISSCNYKNLTTTLKYDTVYKNSDNKLSNPIDINSNNTKTILATELKITGDIFLPEKQDSQNKIVFATFFNDSVIVSQVNNTNSNPITIPATELEISGDIVIPEKLDSQNMANLETENKKAVYNSSHYLFSKAPVKSNIYINKLVPAQLYNPSNNEKIVPAEKYKSLNEDEAVSVNFNYKTILKFRYFNGDKMFIKDREGKLLVDKVYNLLTIEQKKKFKKLYTIINIK